MKQSRHCNYFGRYLNHRPRSRCLLTDDVAIIPFYFWHNLSSKSFLLFDWGSSHVHERDDLPKTMFEKKRGSPCQARMHVKIARDKSARRTSSYAGSFLYNKGLAHDLSMCIGHTKFTFTLSKAYWQKKHSFGKIDNCPKKCTAYELVRRYSLILCKALS